jgi:hypothetical protein
MTRRMACGRGGVVLLLVAAATLLLVTGCVATEDAREGDAMVPQAGAGNRPAARDDQVAAARWPYWPRSLRVHPLTRLMTEDRTGDLILEVRVELFDVDGDTSKGAGVLTVELYDLGDERSEHLLADWVVDLADETKNRLHFDEVTRTYLLRLQLTPAQVPPEPVVRARFESIEGRMMSGELRVR